MHTQTYALQGLHCHACVERVTQKLAPLAQEVRVTLNPMQVVLRDPTADVGALQAAVAQAGAYQLLAPVPTLLTAAEVPQQERGSYRPLWMVVAYILGAALLVQGGHGGLKAITLDGTMRYFMAGFFLVSTVTMVEDLGMAAMALSMAVAAH